MRIYPPLVLCEECGMAYLAYVVVKGTCAHQLVLCTQTLCHGGGQIGHLHAMLEGARRFFRHAAQQRVVGIGQLNKRHVAGETEHAFNGYEQEV